MITLHCSKFQINLCSGLKLQVNDLGSASEVVERTGTREQSTVLQAVTAAEDRHQFPSFIEPKGEVSEQTARKELRTFGLDTQAFVIDQKAAVFCRHKAVDQAHDVVFVCLAEHRHQKRYLAHSMTTVEAVSDVSCMMYLHTGL